MNGITQWIVWAIAVCPAFPCTAAMPGTTRSINVTPTQAICGLTGPAGLTPATLQDPMAVSWDDPITPGRVCSVSVAALVTPLPKGQYYFALTTAFGAGAQPVILGPHLSPVFGRAMGVPVASAPGLLRFGP